MLPVQLHVGLSIPDPSKFQGLKQKNINLAIPIIDVVI